MPQSPEKRAAAYDPAKVYELLFANDLDHMDDYSVRNTATRYALAQAYNQTPACLDGILLCIPRNYKGDLIINDALVGSGITAGRSLNDPRLHSSGNRLNLAEVRDRRSHVPHLQRLGELAVTGAGTVEGLYLASGELGAAIPIGVILGGGVYAIGRSAVNLMRRKRATRTLERFNTWVRQPENGAISFDWGLKVGITPDTEFTDSLPPDQRSMFRSLATQDSTYLRSVSPYNGKPELTVYPGRLVVSLLESDHAPAELWTSGFSERVRELAEAEQALRTAKREFEHEQDLFAHTGYALPGKIEGAEKQVQEYSRALLRASLAVAQHARERTEAYQEAQRIEQAKTLMDQAVLPDVGQKHPLEMHLQVLYDMASRGLAGLDLSQPDSHTIAAELAKYLQGCRGLLTNPAELEQLYGGLRSKFGERLPALPKWEDVRPLMPAHSI